MIDRRDMKKLWDEEFVIESPHRIEIKGELYFSREEVYAFGGGSEYQETIITFKRGRNKTIEGNLADIAYLYNGKKVKITIEVIEGTEA